MTVLPYLMPSYGEATTLSGLLALTTSSVIAFRMRKYVTWKRLGTILLTFIVISGISICFLGRIEGKTMRIVLGAVLIITSLYFSFFRERISIRSTFPYQVGAGCISGVMGGFFGMQGPPAVLYFISSEPDKNHYMAMTQMYFAIGNGMMTLVRAGNGFLTETVCYDYLAGAGGVVLGLL